LILHFDLDHFALFYILEADIILRQVDMSDAMVVLEVLAEDEQVLAVKALVLQD